MLSVAIDAGGISWIISQQTEGKILKENSYNYLIDFSKGVEHYKLVGKPSDYSEVLISKDKCVRK
jgi:hypothetical protein